jgi:nucleoside-diphosphate-sugar epimerase
LGRAISSYFGRELTFDYCEAPEGGTPRRCPDISKLTALGYAPRINLEDGLRLTLDWYVDHFDECALDRTMTEEALERLR